MIDCCILCGAYNSGLAIENSDEAMFMSFCCFFSTLFILMPINAIATVKLRSFSKTLTPTDRPTERKTENGKFSLFSGYVQRIMSRSK